MNESPISRRVRGSLESLRNQGRSRPMRIVEWIAASLFLGFVVAVAGALLVVQHFSQGLPSTDQLANYDPAVVTRLYSADGRLLAEYAKEKRFFLPLSAIPVTVQHAFIAAEDKNFYSHKGIDIWGTLRAIKENLLHYGQGHSLVGGSTITQQVVKNFLLTSEKSFERKIKEAILAYRISNLYSKEKILELYLNEIYLGQGTYGVATAALNYFGKSLDALSTEEAALLAAMPKAPAYFDPSKNYARALQRRNYVIHRMAEDGYITPAEETRALTTAIHVQKRSEQEIVRAEFFAEEVRRALASLYGGNVLYEGGLFVKTTLSPAFQDAADRALRHALTLYDQRHGYRGPVATLRYRTGESLPAALARIQQERAVPLFDRQTLALVLSTTPRIELGTMEGTHGTLALDKSGWGGTAKISEGDVLLVSPMEGDAQRFLLQQVPAVNGAMVVMDPASGKVLAMSGGYSALATEFNRATQARRQPGSAFKPFVYLTALENGFSPTSVIVDGPISLPQGPGLPLWTPKNYEGDYLGPITFRTALERSRNAVTVRIAAMVGIRRIKRVAKRFGIYNDDEAENYSMVLGAKETTLMRLTTAYGMIANGGRRIAPWLIERIDDRNGATIFRRDTRLCEQCLTQPDATANDKAQPPSLADERERVLDPRVAYQVTSILRGVVERGTGTAVKVLGRPVAGKTGTTNESRDTWFIGFTPDIVVGTYIGFDTPKSLGEKETGGRVAAQGFIKFMQIAGKDIPDRDFTPPPGIRLVPVYKANGQPVSIAETGTAQSPGGTIIDEALLIGGPIFRPPNELEEERRNQEASPQVPEGDRVIDAPTTPAETPGGFSPPEAGEMAPYQRPVDPQGFDPTVGARPVTGTGGLY